MEPREALKEQYHAALTMPAECVEKARRRCGGRARHPRMFWRIALHAAFFTQLDWGRTLAAWQPWPGRRERLHPRMWEALRSTKGRVRQRPHPHPLSRSGGRGERRYP